MFAGATALNGGRMMTTNNKWTSEVDVVEVIRRLNTMGAHGGDTIKMVRALFARPGLQLWCLESDAQSALSQVFLPDATASTLQELSRDTYRRAPKDDNRIPKKDPKP